MKVKYSAKDARYTTKDNNVYATILGWPGNNKEVLLTSFSKENWTDKTEIKNVSLLGCTEKIQYKITDKGLEVKTPGKVVDDMAIVFRVELK